MVQPTLQKKSSKGDSELHLSRSGSSGPSKTEGQPPMRFNNSVANKENYSRDPTPSDGSPQSPQGFGIVKGYAASTDQGIVREYNEDRVAVILNVARPENVAEGAWPRCSFFGVYDGHGGSACAEFLRDKLHAFVLQSPHFPANPQAALLAGFEQAEKEFLQWALSDPSKPDISGSCALVVLVVGELCYVANLGDSRAVASLNSGARIKALSQDMKPSLDSEQARISKAGGRIYQSVFEAIDSQTKEISVLYGPLRVLPGRLNVCRSFGDVEAKEPSMGGKPGVIIAVPEIAVLHITKELDFLLLASDGIFDKLENEETIECCWQGIERAVNRGEEQLDQTCYSGVEEVMARSLARKTQDNVSAVMISFKSLRNLERAFQRQETQKQLHERLSNMLKRSSHMSPRRSPPGHFSRPNFSLEFSLAATQSEFHRYF